MRVVTNNKTKRKRGQAWLLGAACAAMLLLVAAIIWWRPVAELELPYLTARSVVVLDVESGKVLYDKDGDSPRTPASLTKLMSMLLVFDEIDAGKLSYEDTITVSAQESDVAGVKLGLVPGETVTVEQLIAGTILNSGCDCMHSLVRLTADDEDSFVARMNEEAKKLKLNGSNFVNCTGLDHSDHYMTALDVARLSRVLVQRHPEYLDFSKLPYMELGGKEFVNTNRLVGKDSRIYGLKTGTSAIGGNNLVTYVKEDDKAYIIVLLDSNNDASRFLETQKVIQALVGEMPDDTSAGS